MLGPGKYDAECSELRKRLKADGLVLIVINGERGQGFSAQLPANLLPQLAGMLEQVAAQIRADDGGIPKGEVQ